MMEDILFPIKRYFGEKDPKNDIDPEKNKFSLLEKIKERKRLRDLEKLKVEDSKKDKSKSRENKIDNGLVFGFGPSNNNAVISPKPSSNKQVGLPLNQCENNNESFHDKKKRKKEKKQKKFNDPGINSEEMSLKDLPDEIDQLEINDTCHTIDESNEITQDSNDETGEKSIKDKEVFPVLGDYKFKKKNKVKRVLPDWLANPSVVSVDLKNLDVSINDIPGLHDMFKNTLRNNNISHFFPVQAQVIPWLLSWTKRSSFLWPCDVCVSAPTGSGKTLAYVLPVLQALMNCRTGSIQALVVLPVQDLADQVASVFRTYSAGTGLKVHLSTGGLSLQQDRTHLLRQRLGIGWECLVDILVITPGRLVEHLYSTPGFSLQQLQYIVIDEADRLVDNVQNNWLRHLDQHLSAQGCPLLTLHQLRHQPRRPQKLLFSATLSTDPEKLNQLNLFQPRLFTSVIEATKDKSTGGEGEFIGKFTTPAELREHVVRCNLAVKPLMLYHLITKNSWSHVLVFTSSSRTGHQLCSLLTLLARKAQQKLTVTEISFEISPDKRKSILNAFIAGRIDVLVCTDALARGMDIHGVQYVVSYDMPKFVKGYIHRVGRTGRAGQQGTAITMVNHSQVGLFQQMLQTAGKQDAVTDLSVDEQELKSLGDAFRDALKELKTATTVEKIEKLHKTKSLKRAPSSRVLGKKRKIKEKPNFQRTVKRMKKN